MPNCKFCGGHKQAMTNFFFSLSKPKCAPQESTPQKFANICHFQQIRINATKFGKTGIHFISDVFAAVALVDAKAPYSLLWLHI